MPNKKISVEGYKCNNCNWEWIPRTYKERPLVCPKCKSSRWDKNKKSKSELKKFAKSVPSEQKEKIDG